MRKRIFNPESYCMKYGILPTPMPTSLQTGRCHDFPIYFGAIPEGETRANIYSMRFDENFEWSSPLCKEMDFGAPGLFDCDGVNPSSVVEMNGEIYLYYVGYQRTETMPYMLMPGLKIFSSDKSKTFRSTVPIIERSSKNPYSCGAPFVMYDESWQMFRMWLWVSEGWIMVGGKPYLQNHIGHARSKDGINWSLDEEVRCLEPNGNEFSLGRPWVTKWAEDRYEMYFCARMRTGGYQLRKAGSTDGINWKRHNSELSGLIKPSDNGWDSEMIAYPAVIDFKGNKYLFYNGNQNGLTGFGVAKI